MGHRGCVQLTTLTIWHADQRAKLMRGIEDAKLRVSGFRRGIPPKAGPQLLISRISGNVTSTAPNRSKASLRCG